MCAVLRSVSPAMAAFGLAMLLVQAAPAQAAFEKEEAEIKALVEDGKYQSAASIINGRPELLAEPRFVRLYTHILTTKYAYAINFSIFALTDLNKGERIEDYRGKPGSYQMVGGPLDELLYARIKKNPDSPELNYAVGEYLSRGEACGCREPGPLKDLPGNDSGYFLRAYQAGVADAWSLFRIGVHYQGAGKLDDAITFYKKSLALNPGDLDATYDLAATYYAKGDDKTALGYVKKVLGRYPDAGLDADAYALHGVILVALKHDAAAEKSFEQALDRQAWHDRAFPELLALYRRTKQNAKYVQRTLDYIALDYGNTYMFNVYLGYLQKAGQTDLDRKIERHLLALKPTDPQQIGALYFNLGRMADMRDDEAEAARRYQLSLAALKTLKEPPQGAIAAITQRLNELGVLNDR